MAVATTPKAGSGGGLRKDDLQAFMNRVFLEDAIAFCTVEMSQALQQVCLLLLIFNFGEDMRADLYSLWNQRRNENSGVSVRQGV